MNKTDLSVQKLDWRLLFLRAGVLQKLKRSSFKKPKPIQAQVIPKILQKKNIVVVSPTASGKTLAYLLPLYQLAKFMNYKALILLPTKELVFQVIQMMRQIDAGFAQRCLALHGGVSLLKSKQTLQRPWSFLVSTPGRLQELISEFPTLFNEIKVIIYDEFDQLLNDSFVLQVKAIEKKIPLAQVAYFSATNFSTNYGFESYRSLFKKPYEKIEYKFKKSKVKEELFLIMNLKNKLKISLELLEQFFKNSENEKKQQSNQALIFVNNRKKAEHLYGILKQYYKNCTFIHGRQESRNQRFQNMMSGKISLIIATNLIGRGVDTLKVNFVLNFDLPHNYEQYVHHKGRVGRVNHLGYYYSLVDTSQYLEWKKLEKGFTKEIPLSLKSVSREKWLLTAKAKHQNTIKKEDRIKSIQKQQ